MEINELNDIWQRFKPEIERELSDVMDKRASPVYNMMRYHLGFTDEHGHRQTDARGKMLRSTLCLLACDAAGGSWQQALPAAAAIELLHNFSLIHDDIEDSSTERRGRSAVWNVWGQPQAINAGDGMHSLAIFSLLRLEKNGTPPVKALQVARLINEASLNICEGQYLDMCYEKRLDITVPDYLSMIELKTAALFRCSLTVGAVMATEEESIITRLGAFGSALGMSFQIRDDALSIWGDEKKTGKSGSNDIRTRKKNLPVIYALQKARGRNREHLREIYGGDTISEPDVQNVFRVLNEINARGYTSALNEKYYHLAIEQLRGLNIPQKARAELEAIASFSYQREY